MSWGFWSKATVKCGCGLQIGLYKCSRGWLYEHHHTKSNGPFDGHICLGSGQEVEFGEHINLAEAAGARSAS